MDQQLLATLAAVVAIFASAFGVFVAIDRLTTAARQRRFAEFLSGASAAEEAGSAQESVLNSLRRDTVARLVGASAVPAWTMAGDVTTVAGYTYIAYRYAPDMVAGKLFNGDWRWLWGGVVLLVFCFTGWFFISSLIGRLDERRRIADDFLEGRTPLEPAQEPARFVRGDPALAALYLTVGVFGLAGGLAVLIARAPEGSLALSATVLGFSLIVNGSARTRRYLARRRGYLWRHPPKATRSDERATKKASEHPKDAI